MKRQRQIKLAVTIAGRAVLRTINIQHPNEAGKPVVAIRYDVKDNAK